MSGRYRLVRVKGRIGVMGRTRATVRVRIRVRGRGRGRGIGIGVRFLGVYG